MSSCRFAGSVSVLFALVFAAAPVRALDRLSAAGQQPEYVPGQVLVRLRPSAEPAGRALRQRLAAHGAKSERPLVSRAGHPLAAVRVIDFDPGADVVALAQALAGDPDVLYAEPNRILHICDLVPNDPYYASQGTWSQPYDDLWGLKKIGLAPVGAGRSAWDTVVGDATRVVAVIDTGLDLDHEDMAGQVWSNTDEVDGNGIDDDGNGYVDDVQGWDYANADNDPTDDNGHGTHCAGTIGARTHNGLGVAGINWNVRIMPLKGLNAYGSGETDKLSQAIVYAADNGAHVLSNSWGGAGDAQVLADAVAYAAGKGCLVVAAAGNSDADADGFIPAKYPETLAVAATDYRDKRALFTNYGATVELSAPGVDILSLRADDTDMYGDGVRIVGERYYRASGTSMACPHVAGVAALLWSLHPDWTAEEVRERLKRTADDIDGLNPEREGLLGTGRVNAFKAATMEPQPNLGVRRAVIHDDSSANPNGRPDPGETFLVELTLSNLWLDAVNLRALLATDDPHLTVLSGEAAFGTIPLGETRSNAASPFFLMLDGDVAFGHVVDCTLELVADNWSGSLPWSFSVSEPEVWVAALVVDDAAAGNGNHLLEPGERAQLAVSFGNSRKGARLGGLACSLAALDPALYVIDGSGTAGPLLAGGRTDTAADPFVVELDAGAAPGVAVGLRLTAEGERAFQRAFDFHLTQPNQTTVLWENEIYDPWGDAYFDPLDALADGAGGIRLLWQDWEDRQLRISYGHWLGGCWVLDENPHYTRADWKWGQRLCLHPDDRPAMSWVEVRVLNEYASTQQVYAADWDYAWSEPHSFGSAADLDAVHQSACGVDRRDRTHVVWFSAANYSEHTIRHSVRSQASWSPPAAVRVLSGNMRVLQYMRLVPGVGDQMVLAWRGSDYYSLFAMVYDGNAWGNPSQLPTQGHYVGEFDLLVDDDGTWHVAFGEYAQQTRLYMNSRDNYAALHTLISGIPRGFGPRLSRGPDGVLHLVYSYDRYLYHRTWSDGVLSPQETVLDLGLHGSFFSGACVPDAHNNLHYVYQTREAGDLFYVKHRVHPAIPSPTATPRPTDTPTVTPTQTPRIHVLLEAR